MRQTGWSTACSIPRRMRGNTGWSTALQHTQHPQAVFSAQSRLGWSLPFRGSSPARLRRWGCGRPAYGRPRAPRRMPPATRVALSARRAGLRTRSWRPWPWPPWCWRACGAPHVPLNLWMRRVNKMTAAATLTHLGCGSATPSSCGDLAPAQLAWAGLGSSMASSGWAPLSGTVSLRWACGSPSPIWCLSGWVPRLRVCTAAEVWDLAFASVGWCRDWRVCTWVGAKTSASAPLLWSQGHEPAPLN